MASLIQRNGIYYAQFFDASRTPDRKRISLKTTKKSLARRILTKLEEAALLGSFDPWTDDPHTLDRPKTVRITLRQAIDRFLEAKQRGGRAENTLKSYGYVLGLFARVTGSDTALERLIPAQFDAYIKDPSCSKATAQGRYGYLKAFVRWCLKEKLLSRNPMENVEPPK